MSLRTKCLKITSGYTWPIVQMLFDLLINFRPAFLMIGAGELICWKEAELLDSLRFLFRFRMEFKTGNSW